MSSLLEIARRGAGLTQAELSRRAGTSRPTLSAYEHGRKSPSLSTVERLLDVAGYELAATPRPSFSEHPVGHGRVAWVADRLWRLPLQQAFATITLPLHLQWSSPRRPVDLRDRRQRQRTYEVLLREGQPDDLTAWIDGALLVDSWNDLVVPKRLRDLWQPAIDRALGFGAQP